MTSYDLIPSVDLPAVLGVPEQRTMSELAHMLCVRPRYLAPSRLALDGPIVLALRYTVAQLRDEPVTAPETVAWLRAGMLVEALDKGDVYSVPELAARMSLWGMETADDWLVRLHQAGAAEQFAAGGWAQVRLWSRRLVMEGK